MLRRCHVMFHAAACAALLAFGPLLSHAQTVPPNPASNLPDGFVGYVGHYGEVFKLRGGWELEASMHGETEVINHYPPFRIDTWDSTEPFKPKPTDFIPENFSRYGLMQLIIMPRSAAATQSFEELKRVKIQALQASGVGFEVFDRPSFSGFSGRWPVESFEVWVSTPYLLSQLYAATPSHFCILTSGQDTPPSTVIDSHYNFLRSSLQDWVVPQTLMNEILHPKPPTPRQIWEKGISLISFTKPIIWMSWLIISAVACMLAGILGAAKRWDPLRRMSLSLLIFSHAGALIGSLVGLVFWPFAWSSPHLSVPSIVACLFMPLLPLLAGRIRGARPRRRASRGVAAWTIFATALLGYVSLVSNWGPDMSPHVPANTALFMFVFYAIGGLIFGLLDSPLDGTDGKRLLLTFALLALMSSPSWAQTALIPINKTMPNIIKEDAATIARIRLNAKGTTPQSLVEKAKAKLKQTQDIYDYQRVEFKGIWSTGDTNDKIDDLFDKQIEPTHLGGKDIFPTPPPIQAIVNRIKDVDSLSQDMRQQLSAAAVRAVEDLRGKEVNEIVAHSWGTEIVYNAILTGAIRPPRRLIVSGMPDGDIEKWKALSKYTGTEVVVYTNSHDLAAVGRDVVDNLSKAGLAQADQIEDVVIRNPQMFEQQWKAACAGKKCNMHDRHPKDTLYDKTYQSFSHDRLEDYAAMVKDGTFAESASTLNARQSALIDAESNRLYADELDKERLAITGGEAARVGGEASFLLAIKNIPQATKQAQDTFQIQEAARIVELKNNSEYLAYKEAVRASEERWQQVERRIDREMRESEARDRQRREHFDQMTKNWEYLKAMTGLACSDPGAFDQLNREGKVPGVSLFDHDFDWQMSMNKREAASLGNQCQAFMLTELLAADRLVTAVDMLNLARRYRRAHPTLVDSFTTSVADFFSALGKAASSLGEIFSSSGSGRSSSGSGGSRSPGGGSGESRGCTNTYIPELNQTIRMCPAD